MIPSSNQTWQWKMTHLKAIAPLKPQKPSEVPKFFSRKNWGDEFTHDFMNISSLQGTFDG
jgi:hypothetical protein